MLINARSPEQLRVAVIDGTDLEDYHVEIAESGLCRGNIYRGVVANVQPSLNAAFIDIGEDRHGFLSVDDVLPSAYHMQPPEGTRRPRIDQVLERRKPIEVQVTKDGVGQKGPALTTNLALAGRYLVLMPYDEMRAISRKAEGDRDKIRERLSKLNVPEGHGVIVRTNGLEQNQTTLNRDLNALLRLWKRVRDAGKGKGPQLLYSDQDLIVQALRDYLDNSIEQVLVDTDESHEKAKGYMQAFMPRSKTKLVRYTDRVPLFSRYNLEQQVERIYDRRVELPSGASIVIDGTEALTAIDVNSGRATKTADHDESILTINLEAARETARQLRLRDIGGLVVVDFIDMRPRKHQRKLEKVMRDSMKVDKARNSVGRISPNGLVEINRQRIKQALRLRTHSPCPTCSGVGSIASAEFAALSVLRRIEARVANGTIQAALVAVHPDVANSLQNGHRRELSLLENEFDMKIEVLAAANLQRTEERIDWTSRDTAVVRKVRTAAIQANEVATSSGRRRGGRKADVDSFEDGPKEGEEAAEAKPKRRRRRRSRKKPTGAAEGTAPESQDTQDSQPADNDTSETGSRAKARRGGRRSSAAKTRTGGDDPPVETGGESKEATEADDEKPTRNRRRRRGGRRRGKAGEDTGGGHADGSKIEPGADDPDAWNSLSLLPAPPKGRKSSGRKSTGRKTRRNLDEHQPKVEGQPVARDVDTPIAASPRPWRWWRWRGEDGEGPPGDAPPSEAPSRDPAPPEPPGDGGEGS